MDAIFIFGARYLYLAAVILIAWAFFRMPRERRRDMIVLAAVALPLIYILGLIAGAIYYDPRPFVAGGFAPLIPHDASNGFPSDHTIFVSALAMIAWKFSRKSSWTIWAIALLVGISRVYVGVHHPIDIVGSIVLAIVGGIAAVRIFDLWHSRRNKPATPDSSSI